MRVQTCPSCGARYNVERVPPGSRFECRSCGDQMTVEEMSAPPKRFALDLLIAGVLALAGLFLWANPEFGFGAAEWPWEIVEGSASLASKVAIVLWAVAGLWAVVSSLGLAVRTRGLIATALAGALLILTLVAEDLTKADLPVPHVPFLSLLGMIALAGGLLVHDRPGRGGIARALAFGGGLLIVAVFTLKFSGGETPIQQMVATIRHWGDSPPDPWWSVIPHWALLLAGVVGLLVGMGASGGWFVWTGLGLLLTYVLLPVVAGALDDDFGSEPWVRVAEYAMSALIPKGLALWWLGAASLADWVRAGGEES